MSKTRIDELQSIVGRLQVDRNAHVDAIAQIDAAFDALGITMPRTKKRGRNRSRHSTWSYPCMATGQSGFDARFAAVLPIMV